MSETIKDVIAIIDGMKQEITLANIKEELEDLSYDVSDLKDRIDDLESEVNYIKNNN